MFDEEWARAAVEIYMGNFRITEAERIAMLDPDPLTAPRPMTSEERRRYPLTTGAIDYFPDALLYVAHVSWRANEQHNPGEPMHWAKDKSVGNGDQIGRHLAERYKMDDDNLLHAGKLAWRALEFLQRQIEERREDRALNNR